MHRKVRIDIFIVCIIFFLFAKTNTSSSTENLNNIEQEIEFIFPLNENGETYGENIYEDVLPDLIAAIGDDGTKGYVREADLSGENFKTPEEALQHIQKNRIPLYGKDGKTILGEFTLSVNY